MQLRTHRLNQIIVFMTTLLMSHSAFGNDHSHHEPVHKSAPRKAPKSQPKRAKVLPKVQPHQIETPAPETKATHPEEGAHHHANHFTVFAGVTKNTEGSGLSVGLDYERFATENIGLVLLVDQTKIKDHTFMIYGLGIGFHFLGGFKMMIAPAVEVAKAEASTGETTETHDVLRISPKASVHSESMVRGSIGYDMHWGPFSIGPTYSVDYTMSNSAIANIFGVSLGFGF